MASIRDALWGTALAGSTKLCPLRGKGLPDFALHVEKVDASIACLTETIRMSHTNDLLQ